MDTEASSINTFSSTAKRSIQCPRTSKTVCPSEWILVTKDMDRPFSKGLTYKELAVASGEKRHDCSNQPSDIADTLQKVPGSTDSDKSQHTVPSKRPLYGTKDAPRAFSMKLKQITVNHGLMPTTSSSESEIKKDLQTAKHVDSVNRSDIGGTHYGYQTMDGKIHGHHKCMRNRQWDSIPHTVTLHKFTHCGISHNNDASDNEAVIMDQDEYIRTLRTTVPPGLKDALADTKAIRAASELLTSLKRALAYTVFTQTWTQDYVVALQSFQQPTDFDVRRRNFITGELQKESYKLAFPEMIPPNHIDIHANSGYRRTKSAVDQKDCGMLGQYLLWKGENAEATGEDRAQRVISWKHETLCEVTCC